MSTPDLEAITARADAAAEGPWETRLSSSPVERMLGNWVIDTSEDASDPRNINYEVHGEAEAQFIAHAREDVPALVGEVRRLRNALTDIAKHQEDMADGLDDSITHEQIHEQLLLGMRAATDAREATQ